MATEGAGVVWAGPREHNHGQCRLRIWKNPLLASQRSCHMEAWTMVASLFRDVSQVFDGHGLQRLTANQLWVHRTVA